MPNEIVIDIHRLERWQDCRHYTKSITLPGGELHVQIPDMPFITHKNVVRVTARIQSSEDFMRLILATAILRENCQSRVPSWCLHLPYVPYARQDRLTDRHEAFSLKAVVPLINNLHYDEVVICDPHSDVTAALIDNVDIRDQLYCVTGHDALQPILTHKDTVIVAPDAGAAKKASVIAQHYQRPAAQATKRRDTATGKLSGTTLLDPAAVAGKTALIVDDICDGGRTFVELARVLRTAGASRIYLYVTHGIFSQGLEALTALDAIYTTNSFLSPPVLDPLSQPVPFHVQELREFPYLEPTRV